MAINNAGVRIDGHHNPNWKGGLIRKICEICSVEYFVKKVHSGSKYCSMKCVGISQKGKPKKSYLKILEKECEVCGGKYTIPSSHAHRYHCCSKKCSNIRRSTLTTGSQNSNWNGGVSKLPYPYNFSGISKGIIKRDGCKCQNPYCCKKDVRLTTHHINHDKQDSSQLNLIALCATCNSKANFNRPYWVELYTGILKAKTKKSGGDWEVESFD